MRPTIRVLDDDLLRRIVDEAKRVLAEVGLEIRGGPLRERLLDGGLRLDASGERVLLAPDVVEAALEAAPASFTLYDRDGRPHAEIGGDGVHFSPGSSGLRVLDHRTGELRGAVTRDLAEYARLVDGLDSIALLATAFSTGDVPAAIADAWRLYVCLASAGKPVVTGAFTEHGVPRLVELLQVFRRDRADLAARPPAIVTVTATGNLRYGEDSCQNLLDAVEAGIPVEIVPVTLMGLIAPVTLVGATVFHTVDALAGVTMAQLLRPGAPVLFGGATGTFHMQAASSPVTAIESMHLDLAYAQVGKSLGLPTQAYTGLSDAKTIDAQAGAETLGGLLLAALAGTDSVSGPGMLDFILVFSLAKLVLDAELCGQVLHLLRPVEERDDLPVDDLVARLLADGHLLTSDHTARHWPAELWLTGAVIDRDTRETWEQRGSPALEARASEEVERRLAAYERPPLQPDADAELRAIVAAGAADAGDLPPLPELPDRPPPAAGAVRRRSRRRRA